MGWRTVAPNLLMSKWGMLALALAADYPVRALDGARFSESIRTEAVTQTANASRRRLLSRDLQYAVAVRLDTVAVSISSASISELADGSSRSLDTDAFVGGQFLLHLDPTGRALVHERPFVPDDIIEISDVSRAMADFFPPLPPVLAIGAEGRDPSGREWHRLSDSSGLRRFRWSSTTTHDTTQTVSDTVATRVDENTREASTLAWHLTRGPVAWSRRIESQLTTRLRGQTIRATVSQRIDVRRAR